MSTVDGHIQAYQLTPTTRTKSLATVHGTPHTVYLQLPFLLIMSLWF